MFGLGGLVVVCVAMIVILLVWYIKRSKIKQISDIDPLEKPKEKVKEVKEPVLVELSDFDSDEYVNDLFNSVFHSIQVDTEWKREISYDKIVFKKEKMVSSYHKKDISLTFSYRFEHVNRDKPSGILEPRTITIHDIELRDGSSSYSRFNFKGQLSNEVKSFIYSVYALWKNKANAKLRAEADKSMADIKSVLGKSVERDEKLDKLLGKN